MKCACAVRATHTRVRAGMCVLQLNIVYHKPVLELVEELKPVVPEGLDTFFFSNSGAEAVEASIKLARHATKKQNIISASAFSFITFFFTSATSPRTARVVTPNQSLCQQLPRPHRGHHVPRQLQDRLQEPVWVRPALFVPYPTNII